MTEGPKKMMTESLRRVLQRLQYPIEVMLVCVYAGTRPTR